MPDRPPGRKPRRLMPALATLAGVVLLAFELMRFRSEGPEAWVWIGVAVLLITLCAFALFDQSPPTSGRP